MSVALAKFVPKVALEVSGCARPIMVDAIRTAIIEFCEVSNAWKEWSEPISVRASERAIEYDHPDKARVIKVLAARFNDEDLEPIIPGRADDLYPRWDIDLAGDPEVFFLRTRDEARLCPHPSVDGELVFEATLRPSEDSTSVADFLWLDHGQAIANGAKAHLMAMANQDWTNPARAVQLRQIFLDVANSLNIGQTVGFSRARLRTRLENR